MTEQHTVTAATLDGKPLDPSQMALVAGQLALGMLGETPGCHICGAKPEWNCMVRLDLAGRTVGYASFWHCVAHRPTPVPIIVAGRAVSVMVPPPSSNWAVVNGLPEPPRQSPPPEPPSWGNLPGPPLRLDR